MRPLNSHARTQNKIQRAGFNYSAPHPPWHVTSCHFYRWWCGYPGLRRWGTRHLWAAQWRSWCCRAAGPWSRAWAGVGRARLLVLRILPATTRSWVPVPAWQGWGTRSLREKAFDQFFKSLFLSKRRRKHLKAKYEGVKTTELGRGTVILTVKWASLDFRFKFSCHNSLLHQFFTSVHPFILAILIHATIKRNARNILKTLAKSNISYSQMLSRNFIKEKQNRKKHFSLSNLSDVQEVNYHHTWWESESRG